MSKAVAWVQALLPALGPFGVFLVAFLDASFLSLPQVNDVLVITAAATHPSSAWGVVAMATLGSVAGCSVMWALGRRGGEALLARRVGAHRTERMRAAFHRYGVWAVAVPAFSPPPMPFKALVVAAGVFHYPFRRFVLAVGISRGLRYTIWATLGAVYGPAALTAFRSIDAWAGAHRGWLLGGAAAVAAATVIVLGLRRRQRLSAGPAAQESATIEACGR
jgi:membrane protein YqaA with SNARE-associated domain